VHPQAHDEDYRRFHVWTHGTLVLSLLLATGCVSERPAHIADANGSVIVPALYFTTIAVEKPAHFPTTEGTTQLIQTGQYVVDSVDNAHLRLSPNDAPTPLVIAAALQSHDMDIPSPLVLAFAEREDEPHVLLLLPDGRALDAIGSFTGIQSRDLIRPHRRYTRQAWTGTVRVEQPKEARDDSGPNKLLLGTVIGSPPIGTSIGQPIPGPETQNKLGQFEIQNLMSNYSQAQALAQSTLAKWGGRFQLEFNTDRPGGDYAQRAETTPESCRAVCLSDGNCQAFTFVKPPAGASAGRCFLKRSVPTAVGNTCCISAKRKSTQEEMQGNIR
jgi:hypothetical protein